MSESPNKSIKFWQELKRRKTGKVIVAYAATAFILLQLADILTPALLLPAWTTRLVTLFLIIGFPVAVIFSWVFDITPEGIKKTESIEESKDSMTVRKPRKGIFRASNIIIAALIVVVVILAYPKIFKRDTLERLRSSGEKISVAVMPFRNMTNDTTWNVWQDGIQTNLIVSLTNAEELKVRQTETINSLLQSKSLTNTASITPSIASNISQKLDANVFIYGSLNQSGSTIRLNAQIVDSKTKEAFKSFQIDGTADNILHIIDSLSVIVKNFLIISVLQKEISPDFQNMAYTNSPEAFRYLIYGDNAFFKKDFPTAAKLYSQAIAIDSNFTVAAIKLSFALEYQDMYDQAKKCCLRVYQKRDQLPIQQKIFANVAYGEIFETPYEEIKYLKQALELDDQLPVVHQSLSYCYYSLYQYDKAIPEFEKALEIYNKWDSKPMWVYCYTLLGDSYHETGQYKKEKKLYKKAEHDFPDDYSLIYRQAILSLTERDTMAANDYIKKYISLLKERSSSDATISKGLAAIYSEAGILDRAEEYYRQALSLEPDNQDRLNALAYFLIDKDRNITEGTQLVNKALALSIDNYEYLDTKAWGLYKQGKYEEALELLEKSWDLRMKYAVYDHDAFLHLEAAKKAIAGLK
jgi:tetratricopeptide (TPR) repeat protein